MEIAGYIFLGLCATTFWYLDGLLAIGLFMNALEPPLISTSKWSKRKIFFIFLALLGPIIHALFLIYIVISVIVMLVCLPGRKYTLATLFDWCFLGLKDVNEEMEKMEEIDSYA